MSLYEKKNIFERMFMTLPELEAYHRAYREYQYEHGEVIHGIRWRAGIHSLILFGLKIKRLILGDKLHIINDRRTGCNRPTIFACTHIGWKDVEMNFAAIKTPAFLFLGDPRSLYRQIEGVVLYLNGVICVDTDSKRDRQIAKDVGIRLLKAGGNLLIYPEGAWNLTENQAVMPLFSGTAEMAICAEADIVPVAIEQYGRRFYVNIGERIPHDAFSLSQKKELSDYLRDVLCTLKWEIWEQYGNDVRSNIPDNYSHTFLSEFHLTENPESKRNRDGFITPKKYTLEDATVARFHSKEVSPEDAFEHLERLIPRFENAYLFSKDNCGFRKSRRTDMGIQGG